MHSNGKLTFPFRVPAEGDVKGRYLVEMTGGSTSLPTNSQKNFTTFVPVALLQDGQFGNNGETTFTVEWLTTTPTDPSNTDVSANTAPETFSFDVIKNNTTFRFRQLRPESLIICSNNQFDTQKTVGDTQDATHIQRIYGNSIWTFPSRVDDDILTVNLYYNQSSLDKILLHTEILYRLELGSKSTLVRFVDAVPIDDDANNRTINARFRMVGSLYDGNVDRIEDSDLNGNTIIYLTPIRPSDPNLYQGISITVGDRNSRVVLTEEDSISEMLGPSDEAAKRQRLWFVLMNEIGPQIRASGLDWAKVNEIRGFGVEEFDQGFAIHMMENLTQLVEGHNFKKRPRFRLLGSTSSIPIPVVVHPRFMFLDSIRGSAKDLTWS